jgi:hypothetical protein
MAKAGETGTSEFRNSTLKQKAVRFFAAGVASVDKWRLDKQAATEWRTKLPPVISEGEKRNGLDVAGILMHWLAWTAAQYREISKLQISFKCSSKQFDVINVAVSHYQSFAPKQRTSKCVPDKQTLSRSRYGVYGSLMPNNGT